MRINNNNNNKQNFKALSSFAKPLGQFYNTNATLPTLAIETGVTLGRAHEANKRGGMPEAVDRLVEQGISAVVWIYGVNILKNIGNFIGKKFLNIKDLNFDIGFDELRNPVKNNKISKKAVGFKAGNILVSTALATYFLASILPKINNAILKKTLKKEEQKNKKEKSETTTETLNVPTFAEFQKKTSTQNKNISFTSLLDKTITAAHVLENNSTARLLITDTGVVAGRFHNAKNKYRKIEGLFRDISSIYFYLFSGAHVVALLNKIKSNANIDPKVLEKIVDMLSEKIQDSSMKTDDFKSAVEKGLDKDVLSKIDGLFDNKKTISVEEFIKAFPQAEKKAFEMAELQPIFDGKGVLTKMQAQDVLSDSWVANPKFLKETFSHATNGASADKMRYVSRKNLEKMRTSIDRFLLQISQESAKENKEITREFIEKLANKNIKRNFAFNIIATAVSIYALGFLIPKIQYAITKKMTNENKFHTEEE
ncbi:hypothetical protein IJ425_00790 [bacterium]|nr:hypothetical protein [bacterium]